MDRPPITCHVVAVPYPGRGHINPMLNLCNLIATKKPNSLVTFIVTEEWLGFLGSDSKLRSSNFRFRTVPNVIPSERGRAADIIGFFKAMSNLEAPVERLLDRLETPPSVIVHDTFLTWVVAVGNRRNIPVASFWTQSATVFSMFYHYDLFSQNRQLKINYSEEGDEWVDYIPGVPPTRVSDLPTPFYGRGKELIELCLEAFSCVPKGQYLLLPTIYELEAGVIDALKNKFFFSIYSIGPAIPYFNTGDGFSSTNGQEDADYFRWLDSQPHCSVLYISQGSFLSVSSAQLEEIIAGVHGSGVRYFWVAREDPYKGGGGDKGLVVPWCDQLKVLCHSSIGGFWSHCGWNSTKEGVFAGTPMLTFPIIWDQIPNSKMIVEDWKIGWRVKKNSSHEGVETLVTREEISGLIQRFMDLENEEGKKLRRRAKELKGICRQATAAGGSSEIDIDAFIEGISQCHNN